MKRYGEANEKTRREAENRRKRSNVLTHPSSNKDKLICCASLNLSPSAFVFLIRSLPAKSQLYKKKYSLIKLFKRGLR